MFNKVILVGNLTRDPEVKFLQSGVAVAEFGVATNRSWTDKQTQEKKEEVTFVDMKCWRRQAEIAGEYLHKGSKVLIEGRLVLDQWEDDNGNKRSKLYVEVENFKMLDSRNSNDSDEEKPKSTNTTKGKGKTQNSTKRQKPVVNDDDNDDDIPF